MYSILRNFSVMILILAFLFVVNTFYNIYEESEIKDSIIDITESYIIEANIKPNGECFRKDVYKNISRKLVLSKDEEESLKYINEPEVTLDTAINIHKVENKIIYIILYTINNSKCIPMLKE